MRSKSPSSRPVSRSRLESVSTAAVRLKTPVYVSQPAIDDSKASCLYKGWLQLPTIAQETEDQLARDTEQKYATEPTFDTSNIYGNHVPAEVMEALGPVIWRRITGQLYIPSKHHCRLVSGCIADHRWFLGALAAVSCKRELLLDLFVSDEMSLRGLYTLRFFKHGKWCPVVVDNRLPCMELQQQLAFCSSGQAQELWPSLVEKAYARLHGGYPALAGGSVADALVDLTGGVLAGKVNLSQEGQMADAAAGVLWSQIADWLAAGSLIVCAAKQPKQSQLDPALAAGIPVNSPYSILAAKSLQSGTRLLQLHCPWSPEGMWQGPWSAGSAEWQSDEGQAALEEDEALAAGLDDPSTFWCSYWDFIEVFDRCWVLQLLPDSWHQIHVAGGWIGTTAGGPATPQAAAAVHGGGGGGAVLPLGGDYLEAAQAQSSCTAWQDNIPAADRLDAATQQQQQQLTRAGIPVSVSSSWCCNPQFRLVASGAGQVVVCLGQRDPQVLHQGHQPKRERDFHIGLLALHNRAAVASGSAAMFQGSRSPSPAGRNRASSPLPGSQHTAAFSAGSRCSTARPCTAASTSSQPTRVWVPDRCVLADTGLSNSRELVLRFSVEQGESYTLVPYTRHAGDTGPFVLRVYCPHAMQLEQLPSPLSLVIGGQWVGHMAGGRSCHHQSWGNSPQYLISCQRETTAIIALVRPDVCNSLLPQPFDPRQCIGIIVCTPQSSADGLGRRAAVWEPAVQVYAESDFTSMEESVLVVQLQPEVPYLLVPSTAEPGTEAPFELRLLSSQAIELVPLPEVHTISHVGEWNIGSAGGCNIHQSWTSNPAFPLKLQRRSACKVSIKRLKAAWSRSQPLGEMLGFYIIKHAALTGPPHQAAAALKQQQLYESVFVPAADCEAELELPAGTPLLLVPCTYAPSVHGGFLVTVTTAATACLAFEPVTSSLAVAVAAAVMPAKEMLGLPAVAGDRPVPLSFQGQLVAGEVVGRHGATL